MTNGGLTGVVTAPTPVAHSVVAVDLEADVQSFWPDLLALDNAFVMLSFTVTSPRQGSVADMKVQVTIDRTGHDEASLVRQQQLVVDTYRDRFPRLEVWPSVEISRLDPHVNVFGVPQFWPDQASFTPATADAFYRSVSDDVHDQGGLVSWNHPFGASGPPLLSAADQASTRRAVFAAMMAKGLYDVDILEVGYSVRGHVSMDTHLDLWDTFSRRGRFLTGNGANDDHQGVAWTSLLNGFVTGVWATSTRQSDVVAALAAGRAYTNHAGRWPHGELDMLVDGSIRMGSVTTDPASSRSLEIYAARLPATSRVEVVQGPVDGAGEDPGTALVRTFPASAFGSTGTVRLQLDTSGSTFVRAHVRNGAGKIIGTGNPIWMLGGESDIVVPLARRT